MKKLILALCATFCLATPAGAQTTLTQGHLAGDEVAFAMVNAELQQLKKAFAAPRYVGMPGVSYAMQRVDAAQTCAVTIGCQPMLTIQSTARAVRRVSRSGPKRDPQLEALAAKLDSLSGKFDTLAQLVLKGQQNGYCKAEIGELQGLAPSAQDIAATALKECMAKRFPDLTALGKLAIEEGVGFTGTPNFIEVKAVEDDPWKSRALIGTGALAGLGFGVGICYNQDNDSPSTEAIDCGSALAVSTVVGTLIGLGVDWVTD